ncbi:unnamed protein product [Soboliphyme baturini]|uniref:Uncharacterized protein n=1 Tax=Soboliphyme baturini TaxID=241478 RepID=A0A183J1M7_9BILA|nr:unnamed protein product [Soboliphyme baturini]
MSSEEEEEYKWTLAGYGASLGLKLNRSDRVAAAATSSSSNSCSRCFEERLGRSLRSTRRAKMADGGG